MTQTDRSLLVFGMGYSAQAVAEQCAADFKTIIGTTRSQEKAAVLGKTGINCLVFNHAAPNAELVNALGSATHLLISIAPGDQDPVLAALPNLMHAAKNLEWIGYLSTVGVYGNHDGAWVDEDTEPRPASRRSIQRLDAENSWQQLADVAGLPLAIFRLSGIYGPGRNAFINIEAGKSRRLIKPGQVFNRIHRNDIGRAVTLAMRKNISGIFNITDDEPSPPQHVVSFAHALMGKEPPPEIDFETADLTPMARSFYGENKRVSNTKSKSELGMEYQWPDYRAALTRMWEEGSWR